MKYIKYLFLALVAAVMLPSCADEGPEPIGTFDCTATFISATPTSIIFEISYANSSMIEGIYSVTLSNGEDSYGLWAIGDSNQGLTTTTCRYTATGLQPGTEYTISVEAMVNGRQDEYGNQNWDYIYLQPSGDFKVSTRAEGDYSDIVHSHTEYLGITNTTASFRVFFDNETMTTIFDQGNFRVKYGTTPDLSGSDTREIFCEGGWTSNNDFQEGGLIMNGENHVGVCLTNLKEDTKYYFSVTGNFRYRPSTDSYEEVDIENVTLDIPDNSFTTTSGEQFIGYFEGYSYGTYSTYPYGDRIGLSITAPTGYEFAPASLGYNFEVVYSTSPDFSNPTVYSEPYSYGYFNNGHSCELTGITPGTTYYYYIIASFVNTELGYPAVVYQNVKVEGADGCGTFITQSSDY